MANKLTVNFRPCDPMPAQGYVLTYRPAGTDDLRVWPENFFSSPIVVFIEEDEDGTDYEGFVQGDCGDGQLGVAMPFDAPNSGGSSASGDESASASTAPAEPPGLLWSFEEVGSKNGRLQLFVNAVSQVDVSANASGSLILADGDTVLAQLTGFGLVTRTLTVENVTTATTLFFGSGLPNQSFSFSAAEGNNYQVTGAVS